MRAQCTASGLKEDYSADLDFSGAIVYWAKSLESLVQRKLIFELATKSNYIKDRNHKLILEQTAKELRENKRKFKLGIIGELYDLKYDKDAKCYPKVMSDVAKDIYNNLFDPYKMTEELFYKILIDIDQFRNNYRNEATHMSFVGEKGAEECHKQLFVIGKLIKTLSEL